MEHLLQYRSLCARRACAVPSEMSTRRLESAGVPDRSRSSCLFTGRLLVRSGGPITPSSHIAMATRNSHDIWRRDGRNGQILWIAGPPDHAAPSVWLVGLITSLLGCVSAETAGAGATRAAV
jgi:hypothetical protein